MKKGRNRDLLTARIFISCQEEHQPLPHHYCIMKCVSTVHTYIHILTHTPAWSRTLTKVLSPCSAKVSGIFLGLSSHNNYYQEAKTEH